MDIAIFLDEVQHWLCKTIGSTKDIALAIVISSTLSRSITVIAFHSDGIAKSRSTPILDGTKTIMVTFRFRIHI